MLFVAVVIYLTVKKLPQGKDVDSSPNIIDYEMQPDSLTGVQADGKILYQQHCASCHAIFKDLAGPALAGVNERWPDKKKLYQFIRNPFPLLNSDPYLKNLKKKYGIVRPAFPNLTNDELDAIFRYIEMGPKRNSLPTP